MNSITIFCAKYLLFISMIIGALLWLRSNKQTRKIICTLTAASSLIALVLTEISSKFINDPRPFVVKNIQPLIQHAADNGFPSDHTIVASLIAFVVYNINKKIGVFLFFLAIMIGTSRVVAQVHHPLDIVGGIVIAYISVFFSQKIIRS